MTADFPNTNEPKNLLIKLLHEDSGGADVELNLYTCVIAALLKTNWSTTCQTAAHQNTNTLQI